jgi:hypothetical protein
MSRRRALAAAIGAAFATATGSLALAAKGKRRRGGSGDGSADSGGLPGTMVGGIWDETIDICHFDPESELGYEIIPIPTPQVPDYLNLGDTLYIDCCVSSDCVALPCNNPTHCAEGACFYEVTEGAACALEDGTIGACNGKGTCVPVAPPEVAAPTMDAAVPTA